MQSEVRERSYVWRVGKVEGSHTTLIDDVFVNESSVAAVVRLDDTTDATGWPRVHPGPLDATTGFRELTVSAEFQLTGPVNDYVLELKARGMAGPCPDLLISVNGHQGLVLTLQSRIDRAHAPMPPSPTAGLIDREITIPAKLLRGGANRIDFTTISIDGIDPTELVASYRPDLGSWFGSTLAWESLGLRPAESDDRRPAVVSVEPLPLYVADADGSLQELLDIIIRDAGSYADISVTVEGPTSARFDPQDTMYSFGDIRWRLSVPETDRPFETAVRVSRSGRENLSTHQCTPSRKWTVHLLPHVHLDVGYTDLQARVMELHSRNLDKALELIDQEPGYKFAVDASFIIDEYARTRTQAQFGRLIDALRKGSITVNAFYAELLTGVTGLEDTYRALYPSAALRREHGIPITYANVTDVPSYSSALPSILAAEGIDSFLAMSNHTRGGTADSDALHLLSPVRWLGQDGNSVLSFFSDSYTQLRFICADPPTTAGLSQGLTGLLRRYEREDYLPTDFPLVGTNSDNEDLGTGYADLVDRWATTYAWPRIRFSSVEEYFASVRPLIDELPSWSGDGGSFWEDGVGTQAISTAINRGSQALLPVAETISALAAAQTVGAVPDLGRLDEAWLCVVMGSEHTWTADTATINAESEKGRRLLEWTVEKIAHGARLTQDQLDRSLSQITDQITLPSLPAILAVNGVSWVRDVWIEVELNPHDEIMDADGALIPQHVVDTRFGLKRVRAMIRDLPAFGYRAFGIASGASSVSGAVSVTTVQAEGETTRPAEIGPAVRELRESGTAHYFVDIDPTTGALVSLRHKKLDREILDDSAPWRLGDVLYVTGGGGPQLRGLGAELNSLFDYDPALPGVDLDIAHADLSLSGVERTPWGWLIESRGSGPTLDDVTVAVELFDETDRVEVRVEFEKQASLAKESVYVAFPFAAAEPTLRYDRQQGWVDPSRDHYLGACNEWFTLQNAVTVSSADVSVAWSSADAPLFSSSDIVRATWPTRFHAKNGSILSWVMNNYWFTNTASSQEGRIRLRYAFQPAAALDLATASRLGRELRAPGIGSRTIHNDRVVNSRRPLGADGALFDLEASDNTVVTVFAGRNESQLTVRLLETAGRPARVVVPYPDSLRAVGAPRALILTPTEDVIGALALDDDDSLIIELAPFEAKTVGLGHRNPAQR